MLLRSVGRLAPGAGDRADVGLAALAPLELHRRDAGLLQARQQFHGVEAGRFLQRVEDLVADFEATLAHGRVTGGFLGLELVDQYVVQAHAAAAVRSEEHTSELQSLMRISYAVFCLKKKKHTYKINPCNTEHTITTN